MGLHRSASFQLLKPERTNREKFRKPCGMACSRFPNSIFSWDFPELAISTLCAMMNMLEGDGADRARSDRADPARFRKCGIGSRSA